MNYAAFSVKDHVIHFFISLIVTCIIFTIPLATNYLLTEVLDFLPAVVNTILLTKDFLVLIIACSILVLLVWIISYFVIDEADCRERSIESIKYAFALLLVQFIGIAGYLIFRLVVY